MKRKLLVLKFGCLENLLYYHISQRTTRRIKLKLYMRGSDLLDLNLNEENVNERIGTTEEFGS